MDFVLQHARENVWAEHIQDKDFFIKPTRITPNGGSLKYAEVGLKTIALPFADSLTNSLYFHVYHIGQIPTHLLGIDVVENKWMPIDVIADEMECYINVYLDNGYVIPRSKCYLMRTWPGKNIILAIENDPKMTFGSSKIFNSGSNSGSVLPNTLNNQGINVRFYTNERFFSTERRSKAVNPDNQMYFETSAYTSQVLNRIKANKNSPVKQGWFVLDGMVMNYEAAVDSYPRLMDKEISVYRDETILGVEYHRLQDLQVFTSIKNRNIRKYIINLNVVPDRLIYWNDVEYYLGRMDGLGFRGLCIPMLRQDPITTITNKTHAIRTDVITDLMNSVDWLTDSNNVYIMAVVRQGGVEAGLIHQHTRIEELFKLPNPVVLSAMSGVNALLTEWKAAELEHDDYASIVEADYGAIIPDMVFNAYGYNAITRYHHPNPLKVEDYTLINGKRWYSVQLSNAASERNKLLNVGVMLVEVLEYDADGLFLGRRRFPYSNGGLLIAEQIYSKDVALIEHYINSIEDLTLNAGEIYSNRIENNDLAAFGFAAYITTSDSTQLQPKWLDVTDIKSYYYMTDTVKADGSKVRTLVWNTGVLAEIGARPMVRINNRVSFKTYNVKDLVKGYRSFPVISIPNNSNNKVPIEPGCIELWMEGRLLIEDIDYVVNWPNIYVGRRVMDINTAKISIRLSGLADPLTSQHEKARETGFVKNGVLSVDGFYDIRNDRNIQINVGGALVHRDTVSFDESPNEHRREYDGRPYQIKDYITPVELYTNRFTQEEKAKSEEIDVKVMRYLNEYLPSSNPNTGVINNTRWMVVSLFLDDIIGRLKTGWLSTELKSDFVPEQADEWVKDVLYLLEVDISYSASTNRNYIRLIPHGKPSAVSLTPLQYKLVDMLATRYLKDMVQINHMITINTGV